MIPSTAKPIVRLEVDQLFEAESLIRKVRRSVIADPENPPLPLDEPAPCLIDRAIGQLVAARTILEGK